MASRKARTPGHEPLLSGRPDPIAPVVASRVTHFPAGGGIGPACGIRPTPMHASEYDSLAPTCEWCSNYVTKTRAVTKARLPWVHVKEPGPQGGQ